LKNFAKKYKNNQWKIKVIRKNIPAGMNCINIKMKVKVVLHVSHLKAIKVLQIILKTEKIARRCIEEIQHLNNPKIILKNIIIVAKIFQNLRNLTKANKNLI
jgi:hypothetical protein